MMLHISLFTAAAEQRRALQDAVGFSAGSSRARATPIRASRRREHVDNAARDHVPGLGGVGGHVRGGGVCLQRIRALPFLDHDKSVGAELGLEAADALGVDRRAIFDAALLGMNRRYVGVEFL